MMQGDIKTEGYEVVLPVDMPFYYPDMTQGDIKIEGYEVVLPVDMPFITQT